MARMSPAEIARRRRVNRAEHYDAKRDAARTPVEATAAVWDHWRGLVAELPDDDAERYAEALARALDAHIDQITTLLEGDDLR